MKLPTALLDYHLPEELIATSPAEPRDASRLLVVSRSDEHMFHAATFRDLPTFLRADDLLVFNSTRVLPARLTGLRSDTGGKVEGLFLAEPEPGTWSVLLTSGGRLRQGTVVKLIGPDGETSGVTLELLRHGEDRGSWLARVGGAGGLGVPSTEILSKLGTTPLPPYIRQARKRLGRDIPDLRDRAWYQTVYVTDRGSSPSGIPGSVAAPTAGLHFTPRLLTQLDAMGLCRAEVVLHVGLGTFKPVETEFVEDHPMHGEWACVPRETILALSERKGREKASSGRVIAVGTTSVRAIESLPEPLPTGPGAADIEFETRLLITPGFRFRLTDGLLTNFHLPRSTLMAMVSALLGNSTHGVERLKSIYARAISEGFRFYSYGDAMLVLP